MGSRRRIRFGAPEIRLTVNLFTMGFARESLWASIDAWKTAKDFRNFGEGSRGA